MIGFQINGRLGNQMFQLAAAWRLALKYNTTVLPDERSGRFDLPDFFDTGIHYPKIWQAAHLLIEHLPVRIKFRTRKILYSALYKYYGLKKIDFSDFKSFYSDFQNTPDQVCLNGYFQSESYFQPYSSEIRNLFKFKSGLIDAWQKFNAQLPKHSHKIAVHIRQSDFRNLGHLDLGSSDLTLPLKYYSELIENLRAEGSLFILLSDEPALMEKWFGSSTDIYISNQSAGIDLLTMSKADTCILSNSTFSWWGAWLNTNPDVQVFVPKYFLGFKIGKEVPERIIPENWIQVEVIQNE